jgi:hypothetical protein
MFTSLAVVLIGVFLAIQSQTAVSTTFQLVVGVAAAVLALLDLFGVSFPVRARG